MNTLKGKKKEFFAKYTKVVGDTTKHYEYKDTDPLELWSWVEQLVKEEVRNAAQECYLQCLAVECGEGQSAEAVATKFPELISRLEE